VSKENLIQLWTDTTSHSTPSFQSPGPSYNRPECEFFLELAASCICDEAKLDVFLGRKSLDQLVFVSSENSGEYSVLEQLLVASLSW
jgi:hypothetical protein